MNDIAARLEDYRKTIDNLDAALVHILAERFRCTREVGFLKAHHALPPKDVEREARQAERLRQLALSSGLDPDFAVSLLNFVINRVIDEHKAIAAGE
jgi:chorismate mutase